MDVPCAADDHCRSIGLLDVNFGLPARSTGSVVLHFLQIGQICRLPNLEPPDMAGDHFKNAAKPARM